MNTQAAKPVQKTAKVAPPLKKRTGWMPTGIFVFLAAILLADYKGWLMQVEDFLNNSEFNYSFGQYQINLYVIVHTVLIVVVIGWVTYWVSRLIERRTSRMKNIHPSSKTLIQKILTVGLYILAGLVTINVLGVDIASFSIVGGAVGLGLGFGLQKIAANFISGLILLFERAVKIGDLIEMQDGTLGFVRKNSARYTLVETIDLREIMIPNEQFIVDKVINWTLNSKQGRIDIAIGVSYASDLDLVKRILLEAAAAYPSALQDPAPQCHLKKFGIYAVEFTLMIWIPDVTVGRSAIQSEIMFDIWNRFKAAGIEMPVPQDTKTGNINVR